MISTVDILSNEIAYHASDEDIGRKMLAPMNPRVVHQGGQPIGHDFHERTGILVRDDSRYGPCRGRVLRGKRRAILKERPGAVALVRPLTPKRVFEGLNHHKAIQG